MEVKNKFDFDVNAVMFMIYLMYKCNMMTRHNLQMMMKVIKATGELDIVKFIAEESGKAT